MNALLDASSSTLLLLTPNTPLINFLVGAIPDAEPALAIEVPNYKRGLPELGAFPIWNPRKRLLIASGGADDRIRNAAALATQKAAAATAINSFIGMARARNLEALPLQNLIYAAKRREAERMLNGGTSDVTAYPYVMQYARLANLEPAVAAAEIALKASLTDEGLLKTEYFRLKYLNLLRRAETVGTIAAITLGFHKEFFGERF